VGGGGDRGPAGGWKRSSVGPGGVTGGPNDLLHLGGWATEAGEESTDLALGALDPRVRELIEAATAGLDWRQFDFVRRAALSDEEAWNGVFAAVEVPAVGRRVLRHRPVPVVIRLSEGEPLDALVRVLAAGTRARASLGLSTALKLPRPLRALLKERRVRVFVEGDEAWLERAAKVGGGSSRIRMIGGDPRALAEAVSGSPDVTIYAGEATRAGRIELLPFLAGQTVSVATHRHGRPSPVAGVRIA
ncbi:MAG: RHH-type transcriptional regulator, proline utilization regulon repressor / proline dehydrogenase, partial [Subtercola sp.]|nr:RHH-type transcriptional regulator, proline utilization regulon repressor / proline dehydrogenase [Subtercola sp.]